MKLRFEFKDSRLAGGNREYAPRLAVWSTDRERMDDAGPGTSVAVVNLAQGSDSLSGDRALHLRRPLPVANHLHSDLCVALYASTLETGCSDTLSPDDRPNTIRAGQVNIHWLGVLKHLADSGNRSIIAEAPLMSLAAYQGVLYHHHFDSAPKSDDEGFARVSAGAEDDATRGMLQVHIEMTSDESLAELRRIVEQDGKEAIATSARRDAAYSSGLHNYVERYYELFPRDGSGELIYPSVSGEKVVFAPDTPNMERFHLPVWSTSGTEQLPFCEWWLVTLDRPHENDASTEAFFLDLARAGLSRAQADEKAVIRTVSEAFGQGTPAARRLAYVDKESPERAALIRAVESTYYASTSLALAFHYTSDGRYVTMHRGRAITLERVSVEDPEQDIASGVSRSGDCEDLEKVIAICAHLIGRGRGSDGTQDWESPLLSSMRRVMQHYVTLHTFGSVRGAQLSDAVPDSSAAISSDAGLAFGKQISKRPLSRVEDGEERLNPRKYWFKALQRERAEHYALWRKFQDAYPEAYESAFAVMPMQDRIPFWRNLVLWIDHYVSVRLSLVIERIERENGIEVIFGEDDTLNVMDAKATAEFRSYSQTEFERRYNDNKSLHLSPVLRVEQLDDEDYGFGADQFSGHYERYPYFFRMQHIFPIANAMLAWAVDPEVPAYYNRNGDLRSSQLSVDTLLGHLKGVVEDVRTYGSPQEEPERVTIMTPLPSIQASAIASESHANRRLYPMPAHGDVTVSGGKLSQRAVAFIEQRTSIADLRASMTPEVRKEARSAPRAFWRTAVSTYYDAWNDRSARLFAALAGHDLDDDLLRHIVSREDEYGAYIMWRNAAMWLEWFVNKIEEPGDATRIRWFDIGRPEKHAALDELFETRGQELIPMTRRAEAKRIAKALLDILGLADNLIMSLNAPYVKHVYRHVTRALGSLGVSPRLLRNERERELASTSTLHYKFPRFLPSDALFGPASAHEDWTGTAMDMAGLATREVLPELTGNVAAVLRRALSLESPTVPGDAMERLEFARNLRGWVALYAREKMVYLVRRLAQNGHAARLENANSVCLAASGVKMSRRDFLARFYHCDDLASTPLSGEERLAFYSRLRQTEPEGADLLIAFDRAIAMEATAPHHEPLSIDAQVLLRNMTSEIVSFDPSEDRSEHLVLSVGAHRSARPTTCGDMVDADDISMSDLMAIDDIARMSSGKMWLTLRGNRYVAELEKTHPLRFWARVIETRLPILYRQGFFVLGKQAVQRYGLPDEKDKAWRNVLPWLSFYLRELFEDSIETLNVEQQYVYQDLNEIRDRVNGRTLSFAEYIAASGAARSVSSFMEDGLFANPNAYTNETLRRVTLLNIIVKYLFSSSETRSRNSSEFRRAMVLFGNLILREPTQPPGTPFVNPPIKSQAGHSVEGDGMLIDNRQDHEVNIGGHMFALFAPTMHIGDLYARHSDLMDKLCGADGPHSSLRSHITDRLRAMKDPRAAATLWRSLPVMIGEGTGPQELNLRPLGDCFGDSEELLARTASHISSADMMQKWDKKAKIDGVSANIYGFQSHLYSSSMTERDPQSGHEYERRLSTFYRRLGHGCSYELNAIDPRFGHLFWVRPERMHFGANLRHFIEGGDALPVPAPPHLRAAYRDDPDSRAALERRGSHVVPYAFRFNETGDGNVYQSEGALGASVVTQRPTFRIESRSVRGKPQEPVTFSVDSESRLADAVRRVAADPNVKEWTVTAHGSLYLTEPGDSQIDAANATASSLFGDHIASKEKFHPSAPLVLRYDRSHDVRFVVEKKKDD